MENERLIELLSAFLDGELSENDRGSALKMIDENPEAKRIFHDLKRMRELLKEGFGHLDAPDLRAGIREAIQNEKIHSVTGNLRGKAEKNLLSKGTMLNRRGGLAFAASIVIVFGLTWYIQREDAAYFARQPELDDRLSVQGEETPADDRGRKENSLTDGVAEEKKLEAQEPVASKIANEAAQTSQKSPISVPPEPRHDGEKEPDQKNQPQPMMANTLQKKPLRQSEVVKFKGDDFAEEMGMMMESPSSPPKRAGMAALSIQEEQPNQISEIKNKSLAENYSINKDQKESTSLSKEPIKSKAEMKKAISAKAYWKNLDFLVYGKVAAANQSAAFSLLNSNLDISRANLSQSTSSIVFQGSYEDLVEIIIPELVSNSFDLKSLDEEGKVSSGASSAGEEASISGEIPVNASFFFKNDYDERILLEESAK